MDKSLKDCIPILRDDVLRAASHGRMNALPFAKFTNQAGTIFNGFGVLIELLQVDQLKKSNGAVDTLTGYETDALLSMMRETCCIMYDSAEEVAEWAEKRLAEVAIHE
ncbi:hypothetical protein ACM5Q9_09720 [Advenella sp. RU8]|uniref:hypothetical protein n=1 Tax=Advenella sp. RU8 TaxID=3399575 RepID=UPI003AAE814E